jgi:hypothetical protein
MIISFGLFQVYWGTKYFPCWSVINGVIHDFTCLILSVPFRLDLYNMCVCLRMIINILVGKYGLDYIWLLKNFSCHYLIFILHR